MVAETCSVADLTLRQMNILVQVVDGTPHACIADFGIATVTRNLDSVRPATHQNAHTPIWSAPEVLLGESLSKESDIYSLAMTMIEVHYEWFVMRAASAYCCCIDTDTLRQGSIQ